ncbi:MAG: translocation/assembly module TamB domain-containing protein [Syntrophobacterales bacterium]|nr:translocation/assembly module TamB domain-containing protein [Syntrophobacterales bacterium]
MKRLAIYGAIILVFAALITAGWRGASWLLYTEEGARWALASISRHTSVQITAGKIEGRLIDHLRLEDLHLTIEPYAVTLRSLEYHLQPRRLLSGGVALETLILTGVRVQDSSVEKQAPDLSWPKVSGIISVLDVSVKKLQIDDISYSAPSRGLLLKDMSVESSVLWRHSNLTISDLILKTPYGSGRGGATAGFYQPSLRFDLDFQVRRQLAGMNAFSAHGLFKPGSRPEQLAGNISLSGSSGGVRRLELAGDVGMTLKSFNLRNFRLSRFAGKGALTGGGSVLLTADKPVFSLKLLLADVDLATALKIPTNINGSITLDGAPARYHGAFTLENNKQGWQKAVATGEYRGSERALEVNTVSAALLAGNVQGKAAMDWQQGFHLKGSLRGKDLDPAGFKADWAGLINFDLAGDVAWENDGKPRGSLKGRLRESRLHNHLLQGEVKANFGDGDINFEKLTLKGSGFALRGSGSFVEKLSFAARIDDLGQFVFGAAGKLNLNGHIRYDSQLSGAATGRGRKLSFGEVKIEKVELDGYLGSKKEAPLFLNAGMKNIVYKDLHIDSGALKVDGAVSRHEIAASLKMKKTALLASLTGGLHNRLWQGRFESITGRDEVGAWKLIQPASVTVSSRKITISPVILAGDEQERIEIKGELTKEPSGGFFGAVWTGLNVKHFGFLLSKELKKELRYGGLITGKMNGKILADGQLETVGQAAVAAGMVKWQQKAEGLDLHFPLAEFAWSSQGIQGRPTAVHLTGLAEATGSVTIEGTRFSVPKGSARFNGSEQGISASVEISPEGGGLLSADFSTPAPFNFSLPETGKFKAQGTDINSEFFRFLLPKNVTLAGVLTGTANGNLLSGRRFSLRGAASLSSPVGASEGKISYRKKDGEINANFRTASLSWDWREKTLNGNLSARLVDYGNLQGSFSLPVEAALPTAFDKKGPLFVSLNGRFREEGLLSFQFPGLIKESHGEIDANVVVEGSWENPLGRGRVTVAKAGAYIPSAGIDVKDVNLSLGLENNLVRVESFYAKSGPGMIKGKGLIRIAGRRVIGYEGSLEGNDFQVVHTPELQVRAAPSLTFSGTPEKLTVRGEVKLPELLIFGPPAGNFILPSSDVVFAGKQQSEGKAFMPVFYAKVRLTLGDRALVRMEGIDAKMAGSIDLEFQRLEAITSRGEIRVVEGSYETYGVSLQIVRGRLFYDGGPINQPALDILALRSLVDVKAGVTIGGLLRTPVIKLYSEPAMSDVDILSYVVFGHSLSSRSNAEQIGLLAQAAGLLLSQGKASGIQDKLKKQFGLSTLDIQSKNSGLAGSIGYKKINGSILPAGDGSGKVNDAADTIVAVGKYLTPQLYLSYGRSLFTGKNIFSLRYSISERWQIETVTGTESGADLYYKIDFK